MELNQCDQNMKSLFLKKMSMNLKLYKIEVI